MDANALNKEARILLDMVKTNGCTLADSVMEIDIQDYCNPQRFEHEKNTLFRQHPQFIGPSCMLPEAGDYFAFDDTGIPLVVLRKSDGGLVAYLNICSHRGAPLVENGVGKAKKGRMLSCPYHGWTYDLEGALNGVPYGQKGFTDMDRSTRGLRPVQVEEQDGCIFVMPDPECTFDIDKTLGGLGKQLQSFGLDDHHLLGIKRVETNINWKLNMDTFHEFYHFDVLHPESIAQMSYSNICNYAQFGRNHSMSSPTLQINELLECDESSWQPRNYISFVMFLFPNTVLFVVNDHFQTWRVYPVSQGRSVVYHSMYLPEAPANEEERAEKQAYFDLINSVAVTEDYSLVEKIQRGLDAGIDRSVLVGRNEPGVQNMHRQIQDIMGSTSLAHSNS
jgi:phenylpropionate dioxygenase-like ring-hydroxylating dioxygenase large terminal subunit